MSGSSQLIYKVGDVEVDTSRGCIRKDDQEQYLRQQTFQVLVYLVEQRSRLVTKEELMNTIWRDTVVTDDALVQCVSDIRKALGDDSRNPRFVRTIPKVGYRFIGPVEELSPGRVTHMETEEFTSVEFEVEETSDESDTETRGQPARYSGGDAESERTGEWENRRTGERFLSLSGSPAPRFPGSRRLVALLVISAVVIPLAIYLGRGYWDSRRPRAEVMPHQDQGKKPVAVMLFENQSGSPDLDWLRGGLADMFVTDLARSKKLTVLSRQQLHVLMDRMGMKSTDRIGLEDALEIARRSHVEAMVLGSFARFGERVRIDARLHDARSGQLLAAESLIADQPPQIFMQVDLLSLKIAAHLGGTLTDQDHKTGLAEVGTNNLEAYRYYSLAVEKAQSFHHSEAIQILEKAIALDPEFAMAHARIGYAYALTWGLAEKAKPYLEKAFHLSERLTERDRLMIAAWYAIANLDYPHAITSYQQIIDQYPLEIEAYVRLGQLLKGEEQWEQAIGILQRGMIIDPEAKDLYNVLGAIYSELGRHDEAVGMFQRYVSLAPAEPNAHDSLGLGYQWAGRYEQTMQEYNRALELNPDFEIAAIHLGNTYLQLGRYRKAIHQYQRYAQLVLSDTERARGYESIAWVYWRKGDLRQAEETAKQAMRYDKHYVGMSLMIAMERGDFVRGEKLVDQLRVRYTNRGARFSARPFSYFRGCLALKKAQTDEAIAQFKDAIRHRPQAWDIDSYEDCLANAYLQLGQLDEAIAEYERILRLNPNYPLVHYHLGQACERKGQRDRARTEYEQFLQIWKDADADIPEVIDAKQRLAGRS